MESRIALSSSSTSIFTSFFDNLFGKSTTTTSNTPKYTAAQIAKIKAQDLRRRRKPAKNALPSSRPRTPTPLTAESAQHPRISRPGECEVQEVRAA